jgi:hypothetical protein
MIVPGFQGVLTLKVETCGRFKTRSALGTSPPCGRSYEFSRFELIPPPLRRFELGVLSFDVTIFLNSELNTQHSKLLN